ncbi:MAG: polysaccharide deacetylase family protein [Ketobacteraceae bacterium]|nr:polysaccharide deacetylase family protein [Ketobacteraceae bacterium]
MKKSLLSILLFRTGLWLLFRRKHKDKLVFLTIHGVKDPSVDSPWTPLRSYLGIPELDAHLALLKRYYNFISVEQACEMIRGERPPKPYSVAITFDDGYANNIDIGFEVLKRHGVPMTLFVATGHVENQKPFWFDRLDYAVQNNISGTYNTSFEGVPIQFDMSNRQSGKRTLVRAIRKILKAKRNDYDLVPKVERFIGSIEALKGRALADVYDKDVNSRVASREKLRGFSAHPLATLGSHTKNHVRLNAQPEEKIRAELNESKDYIEKITGKSCDWFCFPNGVYSEASAELVEEAGYKAAFTTQEGHNNVGDYPYILHRINLPLNTRPEQLACMVAGVFQFPKRGISTS